MNNPTEVYDTTSHLGSNLGAAAKILAGKDYRENEDFNYSFEDYHTSCYVDTVNHTITLKEIDDSFPEPDYDWLAEVANGR